MKILTKLTGIVAIIAAIGAPIARAEYISQVRLAAIERMQSKLGTIRGSLTQSSNNIFLTTMMIEMLRPILPTPEEEVLAPPRITQENEILDAYRERAKTAEELADEIYASISTLEEAAINNPQGAYNVDVEAIADRVSTQVSFTE